MRIAVIAHLKYSIAEPFPGGLEMHTHLLVRHLRRRHEVTLFAAEGSDPALDPVRICPPTGTPVGQREIEDVAAAEHRAYRQILDLLARGDFDLIHNNALHYLPIAMAHTQGKPMVTVLHTPPFPELATAVAERRYRDMAFLAVSDSLAVTWRSEGVMAAVVHNGINLAQFQPRLEAPAPHAIWFGRLVPEKGPHLAIEAAKLAGMPLHLAGPICDDTYWQEMILPRLQEGVAYLGHLDHDALAQAVSGAAVSVCTPRWEEPYGLVVAEALACGTPVAGFARGALPDITDATCGRLAPADDVVGLAKCMRAAAQLSRTDCRRRAEAVCDAKVMVAAYEAVYLEEMSRHGVFSSLAVGRTAAD